MLTVGCGVFHASQKLRLHQGERVFADGDERLAGEFHAVRFEKFAVVEQAVTAGAIDAVQFRLVVVVRRR